MQERLIDTVQSPADIRTMTIAHLHTRADEIRQGIIHRDSLYGGHVGPNLGFVEATIALH